MSQTIWAFAALMVLSLFVVHERRRAIQAQNTMVQQAVAAIGKGVAMERLNMIRAKPFDQATKDAYIDSPTRLTSLASFGAGQDVANDDVDDFNGAVKDIYRVVGADTLTFRAESYVTYADETDPALAAGNTTPTKYKKVTVKVYSIDLLHVDTVRVSQTVSCKNACNW